MPRTRRIAPDNFVHHVINRGNKRHAIFEETADYEDFFRLMAEAMERVPMRILAACLMKNHFHLVLWPHKGTELSAYMTWFMNAQVRRYHRRHGTTGLGHIYQGRYKNFLVQGDAHLYRVLRYVEANPLRAALVRRAEDYRWSSAGRRYTPDGRSYLSDWPIARPVNWGDYINQGIDPDELSSLRQCARRGAPYGGAGWVRWVADEYGLETTISDRGRPKRKGTATFSPFE
ncbi:MAG: transposase [Vicinamibacterales bacterium]